MEQRRAASAAEKKRNFLHKGIGFSLSQPVNGRLVSVLSGLHHDRSKNTRVIARTEENSRGSQ